MRAWRSSLHGALPWGISACCRAAGPLLLRPVRTLILPHCPSPACLPRLCREWVSSEDGEGVATQLISVLVAEHLSATGKHIAY